MITDDLSYIKQSTRGSSGIIFCLHNKYETNPGVILNTQNNKGKEDVFVTLKNKYTMNWEFVDGWYFLELTID